ncbi:unnamed protein product [Linum tenue]|uniref:Protein SPT2 homolog n=1 Tax=Linum tenue TaxID=586396 RepID=A0AAV0L8B6_9ROSI|nr:unnamed protein product [Linum tenue]
MPAHVDKYEAYDDYADELEEDEEEEEEYEQEEETKPSAEELEYLNYRELKKAQIRKKMQKEYGAAAAGSQDNKRKPYLESFGSFFGPSQPVIAQRVIQESKSLLENPHLAMKVINSQRNEKRSSSTATASTNGVTERMSKMKIEQQTKAQKLKDTRDYSFLLSDDAAVPVPAKDPAVRRVSVSQSVQQKNNQPMGNGYRHVNGAREQQRGSVHGNGQPQFGAGSRKAISTSGARPNASPVDSRRQLAKNNGIGPGRPSTGTMKGPSPKIAAGHVEKKTPLPASKTILPPTRKPLPSKMQSGIQRPQLGTRRVVQEPNRHPEYRRIVQDPSRQLENRKAAQEPSRSKTMSNQQPHSRPQMNKPPVRPTSSYPLAQQSSVIKRPVPRRPDDDHIDRYSKPVKRIISHDVRPKKKHSEDEDAFAELRQMLGLVGSSLVSFRELIDTLFYPVNLSRRNAKSLVEWFLRRPKYAEYEDDDVSDMEANFDDIMEEEMRSERIAKQEDEEELKLIEEEERRERMRRMAKKRKLSR